MNGFLLILGMIMDVTPNILIFAPILMPLATAAGIDPYFFAFIIALNLNIGLITPPVGTVLYVAQKIVNVPFGEMCIKLIPFCLVEIGVLFLIVFFPQLYMLPLKWIM
jgi:TRAP-type C4-dicarboxylate transport system permease large subunit